MRYRKHDYKMNITKLFRDCDLFVMLFNTKVGKYTEEEFATAYANFQKTNKPLIYTYFKDTQMTTGSANKKELMSLWAFQEKLEALGHFQTVYINTQDLLLKFGQQLDKLADSGFIDLQAKNHDQTDKSTLSQRNSGIGDNVGGNQTKIWRQITLGSNSTYNENNTKD